jgi:hypothetical protein
VAGDGHPRQMTIPTARAVGTELGLRLDQQEDADGAEDAEDGWIPRPLVFYVLCVLCVFCVLSLSSPRLELEGGNTMASRILGVAAAGLLTLLPAIAKDAPVTTRYRVDQTLTQEIDATAAGKGKQSISFSTSGFLTLTLTDSTGGKVVKVVVDSMMGDSTSPIPASVFDSARGAEYHAFLSSSGKLSELEAVSTSTATQQVQGFFTDFFPWVKVGVKVGETWVDTTARSTVSGTDTVRVQRVITYQAAAKDKRDDQKAIRIATAYASTVAGSQPTPNGPAKVEGTGKGAGVYFVTSDGRYLGGDWELHSALSISGAFTDQPLPITITQTTKVTRLK